jgi:signal peptidase II
LKYRLAILVGVLLDQLIKVWAQNTLSLFESVPVIGSFLSLQLVHNFGAAYGIFQYQRWFLVGFALLVIVGVSVFHKAIVTTVVGRWGLSIFLMGAIGNCVDRLTRGFVIDYAVTPFFPVFNLADVCIDIGIVLLFWELWKSDKQAVPSHD